MNKLEWKFSGTELMDMPDEFDDEFVEFPDFEDEDEDEDEDDEDYEFV